MTYRPFGCGGCGLLFAAFFFCCAAVPVLIATLGGLEDYLLASLCFAWLAWVGFLIGIHVLGCTLRVDVDGLHKTAIYGVVRYHYTWASLQSWKIVKTIDKESKLPCWHAHFEFAGHWPVQVDMPMVGGIPGFHQFLDEIREFVAEREDATSEQWPPHWDADTKA